MDLLQAPNTQLFLDGLGARGALVASAQATESDDSLVSGGLLLVVCTPIPTQSHHFKSLPSSIHILDLIGP